MKTPDIERDVMVITTEEPLTVDFEDIVGRIEPDDWYNEAPWESCDGWEHEWHGTNHYDHPGAYGSYKYVNRSARYGGCGFIEVDDETVIGWGCTGPTGCSKQVRFESIQRAKRKATEQLVDWYMNGWEVSYVHAEYDEYFASFGGIWDSPWGNYTEECLMGCRIEVAEQMESDGYRILNKPEPSYRYNRIEAFKARIRRQLTL